MGGICIKTSHKPSEIEVPSLIKNSMFSSTHQVTKKESIFMTSQLNLRCSTKRKYSKTVEDLQETSKATLLKSSKSKWKSKRSVKVKETDYCVERRNSEVFKKKLINNKFSMNIKENFKGEKIINHYILIKQIGEGSFGKVKLAKRRFIDIEELFAIKIFKQGFMNTKKIDFNEKGGDYIIFLLYILIYILEMKVSDPMVSIRKEIAIMKKLNHLNVIKLYEVIQDPEKEKIYMSILKLCFLNH